MVTILCRSICDGHICVGELRFHGVRIEIDASEDGVVFIRQFLLFGEERK